MFPNLSCHMRLYDNLPSSERYEKSCAHADVISRPPCHDEHVVETHPYLNFSIKHLIKVTLLFNVHKRQQVPLQLRKIENVIQKKSQKSRKFELDGSNSQSYETSSIYKVYCTMYIII